ncbi:Gx transporter family protein [uncultured Senegalimassilia sp.]|uniref:Gx transporter family protein n=1 Tax=uncultured Senegalimassilia sp. TaxID=1714350 RepID=UPI0025E78366|nr:Gx transporter family protein [uncultured Senegalimassilia sp.]
MAVNPRIIATQRLARISLLSALALVLSYIETMIPLPVALPGVKLGLANVAVVVALLGLDMRAAAAVAVVKVMASGFLFGSPMMLMYSLGGTALAFAGSAAVSRIPGLGAVATCMVAAILHNAGQIAVAALLLGTPSVLLSLPPLALAACATGFVTGAVAAGVLASQPDSPYAAESLELLRPRMKRRTPSNGRGFTPLAADVATFGAYRRGTTIAHKLDPRAKIIFAVLFIATTFAAQGAPALLILLAAAMAVQAASGSSARAALRSLKPFAWLIAFVLVFDTLFVNSGDVIWCAGPATITAGGISCAIENVLRFVCVLLGTSALMTTTSPTQLTDGFSLMLRPLGRFGVRTASAGLAMSMTLRFIPTLTKEFNKVCVAQMSRGADFANGGVLQRGLALVSALVPMFAGALRRSESLAYAVEARAFGAVGASRTCLRSYRLRGVDWAALALAAALLLIELALR